VPRFYPPDAPAPERLETEDFVVRWITVADTEMDYAALRAAMPYYMEINPADWRDRTFSLEDNREEMHRHEAENRAHESFTMIVTDPRGERSYGCVYFADLYSLLRAGGAPAPVLEAVGDDECQVHLFLVPESLEWDLDERLVRALIDWLDADWAFRRWTFQADTADARLCAVLARVGLTERHRLKDGKWSVWARATAP
jgi:RimJ/RimL family protein N-acetyltransferase